MRCDHPRISRVGLGTRDSRPTAPACHLEATPGGAADTLALGPRRAASCRPRAGSIRRRVEEASRRRRPPSSHAQCRMATCSNDLSTRCRGRRFRRRRRSRTAVAPVGPRPEWLCVAFLVHVAFGDERCAERARPECSTFSVAYGGWFSSKGPSVKPSCSGGRCRGAVDVTPCPDDSPTSLRASRPPRSPPSAYSPERSFRVMECRSF